MFTDEPLPFDDFIFETLSPVEESARDDNSLVRPFSFLEDAFSPVPLRDIGERFKEHHHIEVDEMVMRVPKISNGGDRVTSPSTPGLGFAAPSESPEATSEEIYSRTTMQMVLAALRDHEQVITDDDASIHSRLEDENAPLMCTEEEELTEEDFVERVLRESIVVRRHIRQRSEEERQLIEARRNAVLISDLDVEELTNIITSGGLLLDEPSAHLGAGADEN